MGDRGWAGRLLAWRAGPGRLLEAEVSRARYFVRAEPHEVLVWAEVRDLDGRRRVDLGSFGAVAPAQAACELDAERRCRQPGRAEERAPVDVRIAPNRRGPRKADKGRELPGGNYRPRAPGAVAPARDVGEALDEALRAFADVIEE